MTPVEKLELILEKVKTLEPEQFVLSDFVYEYNDQDGCGTVCCIVGWFPKFFPKSGFIWEHGDLKSKIFESKRIYDIQQHLSQLLNLPINWIEYLFFGDSKRPNKSLPYLAESAYLARVVYVWEKAIAYLKEHPSIHQEKYSLA